MDSSKVEFGKSSLMHKKNKRINSNNEIKNTLDQVFKHNNIYDKSRRQIIQTKTLKNCKEYR